MITREYTVWCDHINEEDENGDIEEIQCSVWMQISEAKNKKDATNIFKSYGWKMKSRKWLCPACAEGFVIKKGNIAWNSKTREWKTFHNISRDLD